MENRDVTTLNMAAWAIRRGPASYSRILRDFSKGAGPELRRALAILRGHMEGILRNGTPDFVHGRLNLTYSPGQSQTEKLVIAALRSSITSYRGQ